MATDFCGIFEVSTILRPYQFQINQDFKVIIRFHFSHKDQMVTQKRGPFFLGCFVTFAPRLQPLSGQSACGSGEKE